MRERIQLGEAESNLRHILTELPFPVPDATQVRIREFVGVFADSLRREGCRPQQAILRVKRIARESGLTQSLGQRSDNDTDKLASDIVGWTIERYLTALQPGRQGPAIVRRRRFDE